MIDLKSLLLGISIVLIGIYLAIRQQKPAPEREETILFKNREVETAFSAN